ncbi:unnamed protein product [Meloidogyne enterolobii]|uniref:Uncharacterized protein n=1 Tax=Meloidogyne enterolobii TaxID=390850 RepID=A0ACB1AU81_MELEN
MNRRTLQINEIDSEKKLMIHRQQNKYVKNKLDQINECQKKLFENEIEIRRKFNLDKDAQNLIIENYIKGNSEFGEAYERYKNNKRSNKELEVF